jgi:hypothetical protein
LHIGKGLVLVWCVGLEGAVAIRRAGRHLGRVAGAV